MIELVNTATGERTDLRFVSDLSIQLGDVPPEVAAEFRELERFRKRWQMYIAQSFGVPEWVLRDDQPDPPTDP